MKTNDCPVCDGQGEHLGTLGTLDWYRCRNCGMMWNVRLTEEEARAREEELDLQD